MKRLLIAFAALILAVPTYAESNNIATFTPQELPGTQWNRLGENVGSAAWYAYGIDPVGCNAVGSRGAKCATVGILLKVATKAPGNDYSALSILRGEVICTPYSLPDSLFNVNVSTFNVHSIPIREMSSDDAGYRMPIQRGTWLASAVTAACGAVFPRN